MAPFMDIRMIPSTEDVSLNESYFFFKILVTSINPYNLNLINLMKIEVNYKINKSDSYRIGFRGS